MGNPKVGSLFSGIGGLDLGFVRAGFDVAWCVEIDPKARAVLARHFPDARIHADIREVKAEQLESVDVICGGFPCQDLSIAGKRAGLAGKRSGLFYEAMRIVRSVGPRFVIIENVCGLLSSNNGHDFAAVLREMGEGWDCSEVGWRVLDSQYFGVPQRRRRVFIVATDTNGCAEQILGISQGLRGNTSPLSPARETTSDGTGTDTLPDCRFYNGEPIAATPTTRCHDQFMPDKANFYAMAVDLYNGSQSGNVCATLSTHSGSNQSGPRLATRGILRRFTPTECERLQGFPDGWTSGQADATRYHQLGNAVTVNVAEFLARRMRECLSP